MLDNWITILVALAIGGALLAGFVTILRALEAQNKKIANPTVHEILQALTPYAWEAVLAGEKSVLWGIDQVGARLEGTDKKAVADLLYNALPAIIMVGSVPLPIGVVKTFITRPMWEALVKTVYDGATARIEASKPWLISQVDALAPKAHSTP
jgi:hypothetical protein